MGAVYRARDLTLDADIAVKVLDREVACDPKRVEYFRNEVRIARKVTHPNVCRLHDLVEADGLWLITMQYVEGSSLADRLRRDGALPVAEALRILRDIAAGLAAAHEAGVVHRDLKPANVLLLAAGDGARHRRRLRHRRRDAPRSGSRRDGRGRHPRLHVAGAGGRPAGRRAQRRLRVRRPRSPDADRRAAVDRADPGRAPPT